MTTIIVIPTFLINETAGPQRLGSALQPSFTFGCLHPEKPCRRFTSVWLLSLSGTLFLFLALSVFFAGSILMNLLPTTIALVPGICCKANRSIIHSILSLSSKETLWVWAESPHLITWICMKCIQLKKVAQSAFRFSYHNCEDANKLVISFPMWFGLYLNSISARWKRGDGPKRKAAPISATLYPGRKQRRPWTLSSPVRPWAAAFQTRCTDGCICTTDMSGCLATIWSLTVFILLLQDGSD